MSDFWFYIIVWSIVSLSNLAIGYGSLKVGTFLKPHGRIIRGIGWAFVLHGTFGIATIIAAFAYTDIGPVAPIRTSIATLFWPGIAIAFNYAIYCIINLPPAHRSTLLSLHAAAFRLETTINNVRAN